MTTYGFPAFILDGDKIRDLTPEVMDESGRMRVLPAEFWAGTTRHERAMFGHMHGLYSFPTVELVEHLRLIIGDRTAIEIGAGHGVLAEALGITATDSYQQAKPKYAEIYRQAGQPTVPYGPNVKAFDAKQALKKYKPQVAIGCWITEKYDPLRPDAGGNEDGIDMPELVAGVETFILIGNEKIHGDMSIWNRDHAIEYPPFVVSRAMNGTRDFIAMWGVL